VPPARTTAAIMVMALTACSSAAPKAKSTPTPDHPNEVIIVDYVFYPRTLTVPVGTTVTWVNRDIAPHTATYRSFGDQAFDSGSLKHLDTYEHTFKTAGSYTYICVFHQGMTGTIVVQ